MKMIVVVVVVVVGEAPEFGAPPPLGLAAPISAGCTLAVLDASAPAALPLVTGLAEPPASVEGNGAPLWDIGMA